MRVSQWQAAGLCVAVAMAGTGAAAQTAGPDVASLQQAAACSGVLPPFGGRGAGYRAPNGMIGMSNDGGWCWLSVEAGWRGDTVPATGRLVAQPAHGTVAMGPVGQQLRIAYKPAAGFSGRDFFRFRVTGGGQTQVVPVHVTVSPKAS